jgi:hypothetical protein
LYNKQLASLRHNPQLPKDLLLSGSLLRLDAMDSCSTVERLELLLPSPHLTCHKPHPCSFRPYTTNLYCTVLYVSCVQVRFLYLDNKQLVSLRHNPHFSSSFCPS